MKKLWIENIPLPAIVYQESAPSADYDDKTSDMEAWDTSINIMDWSRRRDIISALFYAEAGTQLQNFAGMTIAKKMLGCKYFLIPYSIRIQLTTDEQDLINWTYLLCKTKESRTSCVEAMRILCGHYVRTGLLALSQTQQFYKDISDMVIWFEEANNYDFKNWIHGLAPYETDFSGKNYFSIGLQNELINIYNGNY